MQTPIVTYEVTSAHVIVSASGLHLVACRLATALRGCISLMLLLLIGYAYVIQRDPFLFKIGM